MKKLLFALIVVCVLVGCRLPEKKESVEEYWELEYNKLDIENDELRVSLSEAEKKILSLENEIVYYRELFSKSDVDSTWHKVRGEYTSNALAMICGRIDKLAKNDKSDK